MSITILHDIQISLTPEEALEALQARQRRRRGAVNPALITAAKEAIAMGQVLAAPSALCAEFPVQAVTGEQVILSTGSGHAEGKETPARLARLTVGPKADLLTLARQVLVAVCTIGSALENQVNQLHTGGEDLLSLILDSVGVLILGAVGEAVRSKAEQQALASSWGVSPALSPGSLVGWSLQGQRELCALLPLDEIGVRLNKHCVLEPHKSTSVVIGLGPDYASSHVGSVCIYCALANTCWRRRE